MLNDVRSYSHSRLGPWRSTICISNPRPEGILHKGCIAGVADRRESGMPDTGIWLLYEARVFSPAAKRNRCPSSAIICSPTPPRVLDRQFNIYYEADVFGYLLPTVQNFETARDAQVAQLVEQRTENPRVGGSIPPLGTIIPQNY